MTVRHAGDYDRPILLEMGRHFIDSTSYQATTPVRPEHLDAVVTALLAQGGCWVLEREGWVVGMLGVLLGPLPLTGEPCAMEVMWWVEPGARRSGQGAVALWHLAEEWARTQGAVGMQMLQPVDNPRLALLYARRGYTAVETTWYRRFEQGAA